MAAWRQAISKNIREIRIHLCQTSPGSQGVREFIEGNYVDLKKSNPKLPILIRECSGVRPVIFARYDHGVEKKADLQSLSSEQVTQTLEKLVMEPPQKS